MENFTRESILQAIKRIDESPALINGRESVMYDLVHDGKKYPPILVLSEANKLLGGEEITIRDFYNSTRRAFKYLTDLGFTIMEKDRFTQELYKFLEQSKTNDLTYSHYKKKFLELKVRVSFGKGNAARIPWISFLGEDQKTDNGIYPVYLLYKSSHKLILAYGISETNPPLLNWNFDDEKITIKNYFKEKDLGIPERYGDSFIFKVYDVESLPSQEILEKDLREIIHEYKARLGNKPTTPTKPIEPRPSMSEKKFEINLFLNHLMNAGLLFENKLVTRYCSSLLTKPFLILSGLAGSGKTKLAQAFVQWICGEEEQYKIVPVGADWTNREPLLGYANALDQTKYIKPDNGVVDLILHARDKDHLPHFLILDEMNLSHVERYFADFLSVMESNGKVSFHSGDEEKSGVPAYVTMPSNLFIIGTINVDETTYMFSPKVLDRANVIEFRISEKEITDFLKNPSKPDLGQLKGEGADMAQSFMQMAQTNVFENPANGDLNDTLIKFFSELKKTGAEFGYRSAYEIHRLINQLTVIDPQLKDEEKLDIAIMQKLLPKLHGSRRKLCPVLVTLGGFCVEEDLIKDVEKEVFEKEEFDYETEGVKYPLSLEKITRMHKGAVDNGFASYAEA
ncbi:McrB family protein [Draconibacterium sediminis]|uniref:AAA+ ATPase domain-containing protein n=1 Tax=Draconibacterium sediminis TaxID=1544798 RepID=A0A0D8JEH8_9BACT|nr:DUF3578 domain-containing protein [Draconibacterium sediminis]KJF44233.1 hypothetical protein LH29_01545 [Draconibacterium sediminis]